MTILAGVFAAAMVLEQLGAAPQAGEPCSPARPAVRIDSRNYGAEVTYQVTNRRHDPITRIEMGTSASIVLTPEEMPRLAVTPAGWRGTVVRDDASGAVRVVWEAADAADALGFGSKADFSIRVKALYVVRPGLPMFDFRFAPFTVRMAAGECWSGRTANPHGPPEGGYNALMHAAAVRAIRSHPRTPILIDVPIAESLLRISRQHDLFLTVPLAATFGVTDGFSADLSIGIGLTWKPTPHISASARRTFGTFLFNNRTHVRAAGIDVTIPLSRTWLVEGVSREDRHLVVGVEWFQRDVVKWAGFFEGPQWYASGTGIAIRVGIRDINWSSGP